MSRTFTPITIERTEDDVEANCLGWLQSLGWTVDRTQVGLFYTKDGRPTYIGTKGACDWRLKRSTIHAVHYFELEVKAPGEKPEKKQLEYMAAMKHLGVLAMWADGLETLIRQYSKAFSEAV